MPSAAGRPAETRRFFEDSSTISIRVANHPNKMTDQTPTPLPSLLSASSVLALHDRLTAQWHGQEPAPGDAGKITNSMTDAVAEQHRANFELWHLEDQARAPLASEREIA